MLTNSVSMIRYFYLEVVMNFEEFKTLFKENHKEVVKTIMSFLEIDDEELLNHMIQRTYIAFAGGYARRLYMVQNNIELTPEDMEAYFTSDIDFFSISSSFQEKKQPSNDDDFYMIANSSRSACHVDEIDEFKLHIYTSKEQSNSIALEFKPLKNKLRTLDIPKYERSFTFYKGDQVMVSDFGKNNIFSIRKVTNVGKNIPHVQYVNVSKKKLVESTKSISVDNKMSYVRKMVSTFDLSQTKFFFEHMSEDVDKCVVNSDYANTHDIYQCDITETALNNINQFSRILKYANIGMKFEEEDIKKLMGDEVVNINGGIIEGGYY